MHSFPNLPVLEFQANVLGTPIAVNREVCMPSPLSIPHIFHRLWPGREKARWEYPFKLSKSHSAVLSNVIFFLLEVNRSIRCTVNDKNKKKHQEIQ